MNGPTISSQKVNALIALYELGGYTSELRPILDKMREKGINSDIHNLAHVMWPLSKENLITFLERKGTKGVSARSGSLLVNISITDRGRDRAMQLLGIDTGFVPVMSGRGRSAHAVGQDQTDFRRHGYQAVGGPIEHIKKENPMDHVPFVVLSDEEAAKYRQPKPSGAHGILPDPVIAEESSAEVTQKDAEVIAAPAEVPQKAEASDTHGVSYRADLDNYPEIAAVLAKADKVTRFTKAAELLGDEEAELAIAILEKVKISPLEAEIIRLLG